VAFRGWPAEALDFYEGLEADNTKTYWTAHRATYDECVLAPMRELLAELAPERGEGKIFRPYRDVRFSKDKAPYKTTIAATFAGGGYVSLGAAGLSAGAGMYELAPDQLERYRAAVAASSSGEALEKVVAAVRKKDVQVLGRNTLKVAPRGYPKDHPRGELLRHKGLIAWVDWEPGPWLGTAAAKTRVTGFFRDSRPLVDWLDTHVGPARG
jgi:uncharacterized protein (TIGR02453 family)